MAKPAANFVGGVVVGAAITASAVAVAQLRRERLVQELEFRILGPTVPVNVLHTIRDAEVEYYRRLPVLRRLVEDAQDVGARLWPAGVLRLGLSVGRYRIKGSAILPLLTYAQKQGYLVVEGAPDRRKDRLVTLFTMDPALAEWQAAVVLQHLKDEHPHLRVLGWEEVAADPAAIAKLYSGYMGAGGAWDAWMSDLVPGPHARERLGYDPATGRYAKVLPPTSR
jgi:hypothetical protein